MRVGWLSNVALMVVVVTTGQALVRAESPTLASAATVTTNPGLCVNLQPGCHVFDGVVEFTVDLSASANVITGGQFSLQYDPTVLRFLNISPGVACDPTSPFNLPIVQSVDTLAGTIVYAVGVFPLDPGNGTSGPAALACVRFRMISENSSDLCLVQGTNPAFTILSSQSGASIAIDNSVECPTTKPLPNLSCATVPPTSGCTCPEGMADCTSLDSTCAVGVCNDAVGHCERQPINNGLACDDGSTCTTSDTCVGGFCRGTGCPNPSVCIVSDPECEQFTGNGLTRIMLGSGAPNIVGGQFTFDYDPSTLNFVSIEPGVACDPSSPFSFEVFKKVDQVNGRIGYAVTVDPSMPGLSTQGPATLACLTLAVRSLFNEDICVITGVNPLLTKLVDDQANAIPINNSVDCPVDDLPGKIGCGPPCQLVPTVSAWGIVVLALLLLTAAKVRARFATVSLR